MALLGLGNFLYDYKVSDKGVTYNFWDTEDVHNTAEVTLAESDFPEGVTQADARQVADVAFAQCSKQLNDKRDTRLKKQAAEDLEKKTTEEARVRDTANSFLADASDGSVQPKKVEDDGTKVYNTENVDKDEKTTKK